MIEDIKSVFSNPATYIGLLLFLVVHVIWPKVSEIPFDFTTPTVECMPAAGQIYTSCGTDPQIFHFLPFLLNLMIWTGIGAAVVTGYRRWKEDG